jgi:hypothetical protein
MKLVLAATAALLLSSTPASAATIESGTGDWRDVPMMRQIVDSMDSKAVAYIHEMVETGECTIEGQRKNKLDMTVPFIVLFTADGSVDRLIIEKIGCTKAEGVLAGEVLKMIDRGAYRPVGGMREGWFRGEVSFSHYADS